MSLTNDVEITLGGETYNLRPTLKAANAVSRQYGGFVGAFNALQMLNLEVATFIVRTGTNMKKADGGSISTEDLNDKVWRAGVGKLTAPLARYVAILQNGGKDPDESNEDEAEGSDQGNG
ncbi:hypothetical protein ACP4J4_10390 [Aureimonas ureilytica]|uniref:hypothetical protein n=1 Tax=Aureimonas ureilytica TaxID=401562 RepID=UPI003CEDFAAB